MNIQDWKRDTIVALATPPGEGGIGIIRISGSKAASIVDSIWKGKTKLSQFESHKLYRGDFFHPKSKEKIDNGLLVWMRAPNSFTGEEVFELHMHGGPLLLNHILEACVFLGARLAEPGEFSRRAFLNGKIDLLQAEAIAEMIHAKSEKALANANSQLEGRISEEITFLREKLIDVLAQVEAAIDFPEEEIEILQPIALKKRLEEIDQKLELWLQRFQVGRLIREGIRVALVGRPNVGKSSLLNCFMGEDRAIVHDVPGTTRDVIEGYIQMEGLAWQIFDTAGMREGKEVVEQEGIRRSHRVAEQADLTLWLLDVSQEVTEEDYEVAQRLRPPVIIVRNKADLPRVFSNFSKNGRDLPEWVFQEGVFISAKTGFGIEKLKEMMLKQVGLSILGEKSHAYLNNARHRDALKLAIVALEEALKALQEQLPAECLAADLRRASDALAALLGKIDHEEVLDKIFSQFCIGK